MSETIPTIDCVYAKSQGGVYVATVHIINELLRNKKVVVRHYELPATYEPSNGKLRLARSILGVVRYYIALRFQTHRHQVRRPNFLYTPSPIVAFVALFIPKFTKTKIIRHFHNFSFGEDDVSPWRYIRTVTKGCLPRFFYFAPLLILYFWMEKLSLIRSWKIIAPTEYSKLVILKRYNRINAKNITVIPNGIDKKYYYPAIRKTKSSYFHVLYVGRFVPEKGMRELVNAIMLLNPKRYVLTILSPDFTNPHLFSLFTQIRQKENIRVVHGSTDVIRARFYRNSDICVLPSTGKFEQMPLAYLESIACGTPVLTSNTIRGIHPLQQAISSGLMLPDAQPKTIAARIQWYCSLSYARTSTIQNLCVMASKPFSWSNTAAAIDKLLR